MLTLKYITEHTEEAIAALAKKHFDARSLFEQVIQLDSQRKNAQRQQDDYAAELNKLSKQIGLLFKEGKTQEAEAAKLRTTELKEAVKVQSEKMEQAEQQIIEILLQIPNVPHSSVPEGKTAEDNVVEKEVAYTSELSENALPHWELAKKYDLIDFDLGVKIAGAGFPVYKGKGAQLQRALINFFLDEARKAGYTEIMPPTVVNAASGYGTGQLPDKEGQMYHCQLDDLYLIPTA